VMVALGAVGDVLMHLVVKGYPFIEFRKTIDLDHPGGGRGGGWASCRQGQQDSE